MTEDDFDRIADAIGPDYGATREALRAYYVGGCTKAASAREGGIARPTMTQYVAKWEKTLNSLVLVNWTSIRKLLA